MRRTSIARAGLAAAGALAIAAGTAGAHPSQLDGADSFLNSALDEHAAYGHGADGSTNGRKSVAAESIGLQLIGKTVNAPEFGELGRVADVSAKGNYAYLTMFYEPSCGRGGVQIVDISNPANPVKKGFVPSHVDTYSGEGSQVVTLDTPSFKGDVLVYQNEWCPGTTNGVGGITLVDVRNPNSPKKLVEGAGDFTWAKSSTAKGKPQSKANQTHSAFAWKNRETGRWYVALVDDLEEADVDILDITNPTKPVKVNEWNFDQTAQTGPGRPHGDSVFSHDLVVKRIDGRDIMLLSYWDGGYVQVDVTNVAAPVTLSDTEFEALDPAAPSRGLTAEGNAHQAEFSRDNRFFASTDEDFDPFRVVAEIDAGPYTGDQFTAIQAGDAKPITGSTTVQGPTHFLGLACEAGFPTSAATGAKIAVIERGVCDFQVKIDLAKAAGYESVVVFNRTGEDGCETLVNMLAVTDIPAIFVSRTDGFKILGLSVEAGEYTCDATAAATGTPAGGPRAANPVDIAARFDGWGYTHLYKRGGVHPEQVDIYTPTENQDPAFAEGYGDMTVHEVAADPDRDLFYVSHYALGMRVLAYDDSGFTEVGRFVEEGGSNYWGVEVHKMNGRTYILGSDRDRGLRIFQFNP
ncbi:MAG: PA domain-containing protein [Solirubrobacteraceae bacterium]